MITQTNSNHARIADYLSKQDTSRSVMLVVDTPQLHLSSTDDLAGSPKRFVAAVRRFINIDLSALDLATIRAERKLGLVESSAKIDISAKGPRITLQDGQAANLTLIDQSANVRLKFLSKDEEVPTLQFSLGGELQSFAIEKGKSIVVVGASATKASGAELDLIVITPKVLDEWEIQVPGLSSSDPSKPLDTENPISTGVFYTGGLLPGGEWPISPGSARSNVAHAIQIAGGGLSDQKTKLKVA